MANKKSILFKGYKPHKSEQSNLSKNVKKYHSLKGSGDKGVKISGNFKVTGSPSTSKGISVPSRAITGASGNVQGKVGGMNYSVGGSVGLMDKSRSLNVNLNKNKYNLGFSTYKSPGGSGKSINLSAPLSSTTTVSGGYSKNTSGGKTNKSFNVGAKFNLNKLLKKKKKK